MTLDILTKVGKYQHKDHVGGKYMDIVENIIMCALELLLHWIVCSNNYYNNGDIRYTNKGWEIPA